MSATPAQTAARQQASASESVGLSTGDRTLETREPALPANCQLAPWGTVCLAVLVQRISDKAAVVRSKAIANLATFIAEWTSANQDLQSMTQFREVGQFRSKEQIVAWFLDNRNVVHAALSCSQVLAYRNLSEEVLGNALLDHKVLGC